jgi:hypothetical protein
MISHLELSGHSISPINIGLILMKNLSIKRLLKIVYVSGPELVEAINKLPKNEDGFLRV